MIFILSEDQTAILFALSSFGLKTSLAKKVRLLYISVSAGHDGVVIGKKDYSSYSGTFARLAADVPARQALQQQLDVFTVRTPELG